MRKLALLVVLAALLAAPAARGGEAGEKDKVETSELSAEQAGRLAGLIKQLGAEDWKKREAASKEIEKFGKAALPALREAAGSKDAEVAARAKDLIGKLDPPKKPTPAQMPGGMGIIGGKAVIRFGGAGGVFVLKAANAGGMAFVKRSTVSDGEKTVSIVETNDKITVTIKPKGKGAKAKTCSAGSRAEFKKKFPKVYAQHLATGEEKKKDAAARKKPAAEKKPAE